MSRVLELDLMRYIAASSIGLYHGADPAALGHGVFNAAQLRFLDVKLLFMVSGFVILWSASNRSAS